MIDNVVAFKAPQKSPAPNSKLAKDFPAGDLTDAMRDILARQIATRKADHTDDMRDVFRRQVAIQKTGHTGDIVPRAQPYEP
jgi:hypothetical protein